MATIDGLRPTHIALLDTLTTYARDHGHPPTNRELAATLGVAAGGLATPLAVLEARGYIERAGGYADRRIRLRDKALAWGGAA